MTAAQISANARRFTYRTWSGHTAEVYAAEVAFETSHVVFRSAGGAIVLAEAVANVTMLTEHDNGTAAYPATRRLPAPPPATDGGTP